MAHSASRIRNVCLLGHSGSGKTTLAEAFLFNGGAISRMGNPADGSTASDWDPDEAERGISLHLAVLPFTHQGTKFNVVDAPGDPSFQGEVISSLRVTESALLVVDAVAGAEVGTELAWSQTARLNRPRVILINKMDRENADWDRALESLRAVCKGSALVPLTAPIGQALDFEGIADLVNLQACLGDGDAWTDIPDDVADRVEEHRLALIEAAAETDDELTEKYLEEEDLSAEEIRRGLEQGIARGEITPVFCLSALRNIGVKPLLDALTWVARPADQAPSPLAEADAWPVAEDGPLAAMAFKTIIDRYVGRINYVRLFSGRLAKGDAVVVSGRGTEERLVNLHSVLGKELAAIEDAGAGDIVAATKLTDMVTGDALSHPERPVALAPRAYPKPLFSVAVAPATRADSTKLGQSLSQIAEEDPTLRVTQVAETKQTLLQGIGDIQVAVAVKRLEAKYGVQVKTSTPKVPYKETVTRTGSAQYRHKKQTGGAGQFAEVHMRVEPLERGAGFQYDSEVYGGAISSVYLPSIEKGVHQVMAEGVVAGFPAVDLRVVVFDGKEHPVDSKDIAFQIAGREVFKLAAEQAGATLLEPIYNLEVSVPESNMGDVIGDLNNRRGKVLGMDQEDDRSVVKAEVPFAEIMRYGTDLRSMTQGRGTYALEFLHYEEVPRHLIAKIIEDSREEDEE